MPPSSIQQQRCFDYIQDYLFRINKEHYRELYRKIKEGAREFEKYIKLQKEQRCYNPELEFYAFDVKFDNEIDCQTGIFIVILEFTKYKYVDQYKEDGKINLLLKLEID